MEKPQHKVSLVTNKYPNGLKTAEEIANSLSNGISVDRILELADSGYMPHYRIDGGSPLFIISEVKDWVSKNIIHKCNGSVFPEAIRVVLPAPPVVDRPPDSICNINMLQQIPKYGYQPGVYFLCKNESVVYVGQSITPSSRVASHATSYGKDFDRVYLLPVPISELNNVEAAFINHLKPKYQGRVKNGKGKLVSPISTKTKTEVFEDLQIIL